MAQASNPNGNQSGGLSTRRQRHPMELFRRRFDDLFDQMWGGMLAPFGQDFGETRVWDFGVTQNDKEVTVRAELPGFDENEINVQLENDMLTIRAEKEQKGEGQEEYRRFYRSVSLPPGLDADKAQASYRNGVLELHFPRPEGARGKRIPIQGHEAGGENLTEKMSQASQPEAKGKTTPEKSKK